jgi:hypothetical protein
MLAFMLILLFLDDCVAADSGISSGWLNNLVCGHLGQGKYPTEAQTTAESQIIVHSTYHLPPQHF